MNKSIIKTYEKEQNMINAKITDIPVPVTRTEHFMYSAITGNESGLKADTQAEMYLDAIKNSDTSDLEVLEPRTVLDTYLEARQTGNLDDLPKPRTTSEMLLYQAITGEDLGAKPVSNMDKYLSLLEPNNYDARLEIESEESVIHLTDSKNGRVEVKELEGNTLVNYVTDGTKELTLNGDIEAEGTSVTLTEGVDNGKVDVMCEGNTLVNLVKPYAPIKTINNKDDRFYYLRQSYRLTNSKVYTLIFSISDCQSSTGRLNLVIRDGQDVEYYKNIYTNNLANGVCKFLIDSHIFNNNSSNDILISSIYFVHNGAEEPINTITLSNPLLLEGDYTNKEIPPYFEGMKSVGECEDNKIEILSQNKNLFTNVKTGKYYGGDGVLVSGPNSSYSEDYIKVKTGEVFIGNHLNSSIQIMEYDINKNLIQRVNQIPTAYIVPNKVKFIRLSFYRLNTILNNELQFERGSAITTYVEPKSNKKEITLSEPLRALPNGVKDKIVKIGGKWYVERNCGEIDLSTINEWKSWGDKGTEYYGFYQYVSGLSSVVSEKEVNVCCATRPCIRDMQDIKSALSVGVHAGKGSPHGYIAIGFKRSELTELTSDGVKEWLSKNPTKVVAQLETPIYEELPIEPTVNTYNDTTHISTNSTIPCNMQVKNSGYNVIIKPSTQYTIAFDSNTSGEVGINLGGSKVTTNNNVATVTTPSTLTDDSLRLTGKGIKASKIRLLEGDKTNWIPSFFEGMKSSFEDKLQDDGTYKMEILSNNGNLFRYDSIVKRTPHSEVEYGENYVTITDEYYCGNIVKVKPFTDYYIRADITKYDENSNGSIAIYVSDGKAVGGIIPIDSFGFGYGVFNTKNNNYISVLLYGGSKIRSKVKFSNVLLTELTNKTEYVKNEQNKIQLSLNEPLRGVGDVKDRFVFKNGKLMIERNCGEVVLSGDERWNKYNEFNNTYGFVCSFNLGSSINVLSDIFPVYNGSYVSNTTTYDTEGLFPRADYNYIYIKIEKGKLNSYDTITFKQWLSNNPTTVVYQLAEPTYEEIPLELQKIILEGYESGTLFFDTNIPPKSLISYTANTSNIYKYLDTLKLSKAECDSIINSMERV